MNTSPTTFYLDISGKDGVTNVGSKYTFTSEKCPIEYKNNTENILNIASDSIGHLYDPIICFTYKDILYDNGTEIVETYYKFHNLSRVYQEFVDGNYDVTPRTVWNWIKKGLVKYERTETNRVLIIQDEDYNPIKPPRVAIYARVSSAENKENLERQKDRLVSYANARRIHRGLFKSSSGKLINADVNGALNILRKVIGNYSYDPIKVCSTPLVLEPKN